MVGILPNLNTNQNFECAAFTEDGKQVWCSDTQQTFQLDVPGKVTSYDVRFCNGAFYVCRSETEMDEEKDRYVLTFHVHEGNDGFDEINIKNTGPCVYIDGDLR